MMEWRCCKNAFHSSKKLDILLKCKTSHQYRAREDLLMRRLRRKLGKEIHRPKTSYSKGEQKAKYKFAFRMQTLVPSP